MIVFTSAGSFGSIRNTTGIRRVSPAEIKERVDDAKTAAEKILTSTVKGKVADDLLARGIGDVKTKLN